MRAPITFIYGNCVFGSGVDDGWAAFRVQTSAYAWSSESDKQARLIGLVGALESLEADLQILRVSRHWHVDAYERAMGQRGPGAAGTPADARARYVTRAGSPLEGRETAQPVVFLLASLREPERDVASFLSGLASPASA